MNATLSPADHLTSDERLSRRWNGIRLTPAECVACAAALAATIAEFKTLKFIVEDHGDWLDSGYLGNRILDFLRCQNDHPSTSWITNDIDGPHACELMEELLSHSVIVLANCGLRGEDVARVEGVLVRLRAFIETGLGDD